PGAGSRGQGSDRRNRPPSAEGSWNAQLYPRWQEGDPRQQNCWRGGTVTFDISNDAPTMAGARATFAIALRFPGNQTVLPDGRVVWSQDCTVNATPVITGPRIHPAAAAPRSHPQPRSGSAGPAVICPLPSLLPGLAVGAGGAEPALAAPRATPSPHRAGDRTQESWLSDPPLR
uniref:PMEL/NMB N-terminal domain-containing protein n=1 Tax=Chelydra serpentina TaxID=8475 RepID=A0A8C3S9I2_CHESE